jgi:hypothetical protein
VEEAAVEKGVIAASVPRLSPRRHGHSDHVQGKAEGVGARGAAVTWVGGAVEA